MRVNFDVNGTFYREIKVKCAEEGMHISSVGRRLFQGWVDGEVNLGTATA